MLLALDVGNTHVVVGLMEGREVRRSFRIATRRDNAVGDYAVALSQLLELAEVDRQEEHKMLVVGFACVSNEKSHAERMLQHILDFMEKNTEAELISAEYEVY